MRFIILLAILIAFQGALTAHAEPSTEGPASAPAITARKKLDGVVAKADQTQNESVAAARKAYLASLQESLDAALKAASLEDSKWAKAEIERIKAGEPASTDKPKLPMAAAAQTRFARALEKSRDDRSRTLDVARRQYITELEGAKRTALSEAKDIDEAGRIAAEIERSKVMEFEPAAALGAAAPPGNAAPANPAAERKPGKINLLKLVDLDRDPVIYGTFKWEKDGLWIDGDGVKTIRLPYLPPAEYDFITEFTILRPGEGDFHMVCASGTTAFIWVGGGWANTGCCFAVLNGEWDRRNPTYSRLPQGVFEANRRTRMVVSVRRDGVSASINGKTVAQLATDFKNLDLQGHIGVGLGVLGIHTANHSIVHSAEVVEIGGPGKIIRHLDAQQTRAQAMAFRNLRVGKTLSLTEMRPRAQQIGWGTFMINQNGFSQPVMINGRECGRYLYAHAPSSLIYDIPEGAIGFRAVGARPAGTFRADIGQWRLAVCVDDCEVLLSRGIQEEGGHIDIEIPIPKGSRLLELRADPLGKSEHDGAIWANPEFLFPADAGTGR